MEQQKNSSGRVLTGAVLVVIGIALLLQNFSLIPFNVGRIVFSWPAVLLFVGAVILVKGTNRVMGAGFILFGGLLMLPKIFPGLDIDSGVIIPVIILFTGGYLILRAKRKDDTNTWRGRSDVGSGPEEKSDRLEVLAVFGGGNRRYNSQNFKGGAVTVVFGGTEVDLTSCELAPGEQTIDCTVLFGGMELFVPRGWNVIIDVFPIFGGFGHDTKKLPPAPADSGKTLIVKGVVIFGGGEIKYF